MSSASFLTLGRNVALDDASGPNTLCFDHKLISLATANGPATSLMLVSLGDQKLKHALSYVRVSSFEWFITNNIHSLIGLSHCDEVLKY